MVVNIHRLAESVDKYLFSSDYTINLHTSHICAKALYYVRMVCFIYLTIIYVWSIAAAPVAFYNIMYLTMIGYFLTWLYFALVLQDSFLNEREAPISQKLKKYIEIVYQTGFSIELPITLVFWTVLFGIVLDTPGVTTQDIIINANLHAGPMLCLLVDFAFNTSQFPRRHFVFVIILSVIYLIINMTYTLLVKPIYKPIDYISVMSYVLLLVTLVLSYGMHWFGRLIYRKFKHPKLRLSMTDRLVEAKQGEQIDSGNKADLGNQLNNVRQ